MLRAKRGGVGQPVSCTAGAAVDQLERVVLLALDRTRAAFAAPASDRVQAALV